MALETKLTFLDTESIKGYGFNFSGAALATFHSLCNRGALLHVTTSIVTREVESLIDTQLHAALESMKKFRRQAAILGSDDDPHIHALFRREYEESLVERAKHIYRNFLSETHAEVLEISNVDPELAFNRYFERLSPFRQGRKKNEFPDAFNLLALEAHSESVGERIYVVSRDEDVRLYCKGSERLLYCEALDHLLDLYTSQQAKIHDALKQFVIDSETEIARWLAGDLELRGAVNEGSWPESRVEEFYASVRKFYEPRVIIVQENWLATIMMEVEINILARVEGPDLQSVQAGYASKTYIKDHRLTVRVDLDFDVKQGELGRCEIKDVRLEPRVDSIPIHIDAWD